MQDTKEAEFAACLLMVGGPAAIGWGDTLEERLEMWDGDCLPCDHAADTEPVADMDYMIQCSDWYSNNVGDGSYSWRTAGRSPDFGTWYADFKVWILETRDEQRTRDTVPCSTTRLRAGT